MSLNTLKGGLMGAALAAALTLPAQTAHATAEPFIGEVAIFGGNFCPRAWAEAAGQLLPINSHQSLYSLYGTYYGGDGRSTFALPDLRGRVPVSVGTGTGLSTYTQGQRVGTETRTLTVPEMPSHNHTANGVLNPAGPPAVSR